MAKKIKHKRGFYRELKLEMKAAKMSRIRVFKSVEFWVKHINNPAKDVHFYVNWTHGSELLEGWDFIGKLDKEQYEEHVLTRTHDTPRTRKDKAIYQSVMHGIPHLSEIS